MSIRHRSPRTGPLRTLRGRMLFWILSVAIPIYAIASWMSYQAAAGRLVAQAERDADELAIRLAAGLDAVIRPIEGGIRTVAAMLEEVDPPRTAYEPRIRGILASWPDVYGSTIAAEADRDPFAPYFYRGKDGIEYVDLAQHSYAYLESAWYRRAADALEPAWSPPYFDAGGGETWMVTYSVPFFRTRDGQRSLAGVVTADLALDWVKTAAAAVQLGPIGVGWIFSPPDQTDFVAPVGATPERIAARSTLPDEGWIREQGERMHGAGTFFQSVAAPGSGNRLYLAVRNLETLDWRMVLAIPGAQLLADARDLLRRQLVLGAAGLIGLVTAIFLVAAGISRPIRALASSVGTMQDEEFDFALPDGSSTDEIGVLTAALRRMRDALQRHIQLRAESLAAERRLEHELAFAATIQQSMLPAPDAATLPAGAQVDAALLPAKRVGGDLYDYFAAGDAGLLFAVGDVSDKGIPAALCMARLSSLVRLLGATGESPDRLLREVNARFGERNEACMFATIACALLDLRSGHLRLASAGHEPPVLREPDGTVHLLAMESGPAIGVEVAADYPLVERYLAPGDTVVLFTDGVTEAVAVDGSLFGIERLVELVRSAPPSHDAGPLVRHITAALTAQGAHFHAADDLTVLAVTFAPPGVTVGATAEGTRWLIPAETTAEGVRRTRSRLQGILAARYVPEGRIVEADLVTEELLTNVVKAAGSRKQGMQLSLQVELTPAAISLTVRDDGAPFDPLARGRPDLDANICSRDIGGLGIHMVRELAASCRYERVAGFNEFEVRLHRSS